MSTEEGLEFLPIFFSLFFECFRSLKVLAVIADAAGVELNAGKSLGKNAGFADHYHLVMNYEC